ncbi:uncharacterized protein [Polyergus mexicanus]|uniref:uncharacterized protein n=1 Tax=Polyergus mexicanus TaxID=615972 RepID=UPI0038B586E0
MKRIYVIAIAFLASWNVCIANENQQLIQETGPLDNIVKECPFKDPKNTTIHLAHESDCTKFYKCLVGRKIEQLCPLMWPDDTNKRLHFNRALQVCDWPGQAGCQDCLEPDINGNYPPESWIADPDRRDCRGYIICKNGERQRGTCPNGQCFSRTCQGCIPKDGNCEGGAIVTPTTTSTTMSTTPTLCKTKDRKGHDCVCSKYYQCYDNQDWILHECEDGLHFSYTTWKCLSPEKANWIYVTAVAFLASWSVCIANENQQFIQDTGPLDNIVTECPFTDSKNTTIHLAHESDCTKFYTCLAGRRIEQKCPLMWKDDPYKRLHFNRTIQVCDWPWLAGCQDCPELDKNGNYPPESWIADSDSTNCRGYIICKNGGRQRESCPSDQCFSRTCQRCVKNRENGNCEGGSIVTPDTPTTPTPRPCKTGNRKAHECDCFKYYQCYDNQDWIRSECEGGLHFSPAKEDCLPPDEAKCTISRKTMEV